MTISEIPPSGTCRAHAFRLPPKTPFLTALKEHASVILARHHDCRSVFVLTAVGSLSSVTLRLANASRRADEGLEATGRSKSPPSAEPVGTTSSSRRIKKGTPMGNEIKRYDENFEIVSLVGTFSPDGGCHLHLSLSDGDGATIGGHLIDGVVYTTVEVVLGTIDGVEFGREYDDETGYTELIVRGLGRGVLPNGHLWMAVVGVVGLWVLGSMRR